MQILWIILGIAAGGLAVYLILNKKREELPKENTDQSFLMLQQQMQELSRTVNQSLVGITREQTKTNEATREFINIAGKLSDLEKTLKHQKQRGNWGEASLELILSNTLAPGEYQMQYEFKNRETVDAVIVTKEGMIPIDAKFSLDNYDRVVHAMDDNQREVLEKEFKNDLKRRIDETAKYVRPEEGTLPFAFMYIPAEAIYYDLLVNEVGAVKVNTRNLIDYAYNDKKVIIVSPTTFMAYLQSILYGFKAFKIEKSANEIIKKVGDLGKHLKAYEDYHLRLGTALNTVANHYNASNKELKKIDKDVLKISGTSPELALLEVEKTKIED